VPVQIEAGAPQHRVGFATQVRNGPGRADIGRRGEQADDPELADRVAVDAEALHADVVEIDATMHARLGVGFGDEQGPWLVEERAQLRRDGHNLAAAREQRHVVAAQQAKPAVAHRHEIAALTGQRVVAHAKQREVVVDQPFQKLDGFRDVVHRDHRRIVPQIGDDAVDACDHRRPVLDADAHIGQHLIERSHDLGAPLRVIDAFNVHVDETFAKLAALAMGLGRPPDQGSGLPVTHRRQHRVDNKANVETALRQLGHHRIDQERHIVVDDLDHRDGLEPAIASRRRLATNLGHAAPAHGEKRPSLTSEGRKLGGLIGHEVLRRGAGEQQLGEVFRNVGVRLAQQASRGVKPRAGRFLLAHVDVTGRGDVSHDRIALGCARRL
jgi:hypothetical protein